MDPKLLFLALLLLVEARAAPVGFVQQDESALKRQEFEKHLEDYLYWYYERYIRPRNHPHPQKDDERFEHDVHDGMQSDQPAEEVHEMDPLQISPLLVNLSSMMNITKTSEENNNFFGDEQYRKTSRDRRNSEVEDRDRDTWVQILKDKLLLQTGRTNGSLAKPQDPHSLPPNISAIWEAFNDSFAGEDFVAEKIRSYYPSCEVPKNTDQEMWKDENTMNLYFNIEQSENSGVNIAAATLRLYRLPQENSTSSENSDCDNSGEEEEKLLRVTIYWYTKSLKKHRVKRRISDSKVVGDGARWVELSVKPATKAWTGGKNLGLAVMVEDQDGTLLKADRFFKGPSCTQPRSPSRLSFSTGSQANWAAVMELLEEMQQEPCITAYHCRP